MATKQPEPDPQLEQLRAEIKEFAEEGGAPMPNAILTVLASAFMTTKRVRSYCNTCKKAIYVDIPDAKAALDAAQELMNRTWGRPGQSEGQQGPAFVVRIVRPREVETS